MTEFIDGYVARSYRNQAIEGVKVWDEREAY
jgi:phosphatidylglycerophosphate synthase